MLSRTGVVYVQGEKYLPKNAEKQFAFELVRELNRVRTLGHERNGDELDIRRLDEGQETW